MSGSSPLLIFPDSPLLSVLVIAAAAVFCLYLARRQAHESIRAFCRVARNAMRTASRSVMLAEASLRQRNREVLLAEGMEAVEREVEREFQRVGVLVERDLQGYPAMNRKLSEQIARIDQDYRESSEIPPTPPVWIKAVEAVAAIKDKEGGKVVGEILADIHKSLVKMQKQAEEDYRKATGERHRILSGMMPYWRKLSTTLESVGRTMTSLQDKARVIDRLMDDYDEIRKGTDKAVRKLSSSSMTSFFISALGLFIAVGGAVVNFNLVALPMSEMFGGSTYIAGFRASDVGALFLILLETLTGIFFMEALGFTKLFPFIASYDDKRRHRWAMIMLVFLFVFAGMESALAFMRDLIAANNEALLQSLTGAGGVVAPHTSVIPTITQMVMGFILPFILAMAAIPLESFVHAARTVAGVAAAAFLRLVAGLLRIGGTSFYYMGSFAVGLYDLVIFPPLWMEEKIGKRRNAAAEGGRTGEADAGEDTASREEGE